MPENVNARFRFTRLKGFRAAVGDIRECGLPFKFEIGQFAIRARIAALPVVKSDYTGEIGRWLWLGQPTNLRSIT
jgi:hypothetical protein